MAHNTKFAKYCLDDNNLYSVDGSGTSRESGRADVRKENELSDVVKEHRLKIFTLNGRRMAPLTLLFLEGGV